MNKKDRKVIEALPVRFEQLDLEAKPKSIEDRLDNFKRVVVKSFGPAIKRIQMGLTERFEEYLSWDQKRIANLDVFTRGYFEEWKAATAKQRSELTLKWAKALAKQPSRATAGPSKQFPPQLKVTSVQSW